MDKEKKADIRLWRTQILEIGKRMHSQGEEDMVYCMNMGGRSDWVFVKKKLRKRYREMKNIE